jgi:hypothetical protein
VCVRACRARTLLLTDMNAVRRMTAARQRVGGALVAATLTQKIFLNTNCCPLWLSVICLRHDVKDTIISSFVKYSGKHEGLVFVVLFWSNFRLP